MVEVEQVLKDLNDLIEVQKNDNETEDYMRGLYNGLVLARSLITKEDPIYE